MIRPATRKQRAAPLDYRQRAAAGEAPVSLLEKHKADRKPGSGSQILVWEELREAPAAGER